MLTAEKFRPQRDRGPRYVCSAARRTNMKNPIDARYENKNNCPEREPTEEQFLDQFAALEESLALLQALIHSMSGNVKLFGSLARHLRRSGCPATDHRDKTGCRDTHFRQ
jgi:hypothetical protein